MPVATPSWTATGQRRERASDGSKEKASAPAPIQGISDALQLSAGFTEVRARRRSGRVSCWSRGQPKETAISDAVDLSVAFRTKCAVRPSGPLTCWGDLTDATRGGSTAVERKGEYDILGLGNATRVSAGSDHACALTKDGDVVCWGSNRYSQVGDGSGSFVPAFVPVPAP